MSDPITLVPNQTHCLNCSARYVEILDSCALCASRGITEQAIDLLHVTDTPLGLADGLDSDYALRDRTGRPVRWEYTVLADGQLVHSQDAELVLDPRARLQQVTRRGATLSLVETDLGTQVRVQEPHAPAPYDDHIIGRVIMGSFQFRMFNDIGLAPSALHAIADLVQAHLDTTEGGNHD